MKAPTKVSIGDVVPAMPGAKPKKFALTKGGNKANASKGGQRSASGRRLEKFLKSLDTEDEQ